MSVSARLCVCTRLQLRSRLNVYVNIRYTIEPVAFHTLYTTV